ncbi:MAG: helix-turn-helix domain-containing protein [Eubacteriaceae bacterium]|nr:helix-turn-helix domain-containing protein [Eubacteriaceae bacterium]
MDDYNYSVASVEKTFKIIELLSKNNGKLHINEIAYSLDCSVSSINRFLITMQQLGYVNKDEKSNKYYLNAKLYAIANNIVLQHPFTIKYLDLMYSLSYEYHMTTHIIVFCGYQAIVLHKNNILQSINLNNAFFDPTRHHYCSAPGKLLLSTLPEKNLSDYFKKTTIIKFNKNTLSTEIEVRNNLEKIKKVGVSIHNEEWLIGSFAISFPLKINDKIEGAFTFMCEIKDKDKIYNNVAITNIKAKLNK